MATLKQVRDKADAKLTQFWQLLTSQQDAYFAKHGKYFQLLVTGGRGVANDEEYDFVLRIPSDEPHTIDVDFPWTDQLPFEIAVDEWVGPGGNGYRATVTVEHNGTLYQRSRDNSQNDTGWYSLIESAIWATWRTAVWQLTSSLTGRWKKRRGRALIATAAMI